MNVIGQTTKIEDKEFGLSWYGALFYVMVLLVLQISISIVVYLPMKWIDSVSLLASFLTGAVLQVTGYYIFIRWAFLRKGFAFDFKKRTLGHRSAKNHIMLLSFFLAVFVTAFISPMMAPIEVSQALEDFSQTLQQFPMIGLVLILVVAPVFEEIIFRGILLRGMLKKHNPMIGIVLSGVLFGAFHMNIHQFVAASLLGIMAGWIYYKTGRLWYSMFMHFSYNLSVVIVSALTYESLGGDQILWIPTVGSALVILLTVKSMYKSLSKDVISD